MFTNKDLQKIAADFISTSKKIYLGIGAVNLGQAFLNEDLKIVAVSMKDKNGDPLDDIVGKGIDEVTDNPDKNVAMVTFVSLPAADKSGYKEFLVVIVHANEKDELFIYSEINKGILGTTFGKCKEYKNGFLGFEKEYAALLPVDGKKYYRKLNEHIPTVLSCQ